MGEVYEAADQHLRGKRLALKIVREDVNAEWRDRLPLEREVLAAREVHHPNVCPTFDLFRMEGPSGPLTFLTMKLLSGESLAERIRRKVPQPLDEALVLAYFESGVRSKEARALAQALLDANPTHNPTTI